VPVQFESIDGLSDLDRVCLADGSLAFWEYTESGC